MFKNECTCKVGSESCCTDGLDDMSIAALKYFGVTDDIREAGYILTNGVMLKMGRMDAYGPYGRMDHSSICDVDEVREAIVEQLAGDEWGEEDSGLEPISDPRELDERGGWNEGSRMCIESFMSMTDAIRNASLGTKTDVKLSLEMPQEPTFLQAATIAKQLGKHYSFDGESEMIIEGWFLRSGSFMELKLRKPTARSIIATIWRERKRMYSK